MEGDRPLESTRLRVYPGGNARVRRARRRRTDEVADRLSALERRVEEALAASDLGSGAVGRELARAAFDETLAAWASLRRWRASGARWPTGLGEHLGTLWLHGLYRYWWRVETFGVERVPAAGPALLVANRAGSLVPYEALMIAVALDVDHPAHRRARPLIDTWVTRLPLLGPLLAGAGALPATSPRLRHLLLRDQAAIALPEGRAALAKSFGHRYRLAGFGRGGFARISIETGTPIVPVAVIGAEEVHPVLARLDAPGRLLGLPTLPITPTFPWLGLAGLVPLPTKWTLHFGEPIDVAARYPREPRAAAEQVARLRDQVRERLQALVVEGLRRRRSIFLG